MAGNINRVTLLGNVGNDPEMRATVAGESVVSFSLATSESWHDRTTGERRERTEWHHITIFNQRLTEFAFEQLHKGSKVYVEGMLQTRDWKDQHGQPHRTVEIVLSRYRGELILLASPRNVNASAADAGKASYVDDGPPS